MRSSAQMVSYELALGLSLVGVMIAYRTLRLEEMVVAQGQAVLGPLPAIGLLLQPVGFLIFFASAFSRFSFTLNFTISAISFSGTGSSHENWIVPLLIL